ncbi:hypothetical protein ACH347_27430 [Saccharopolyspora sp. 5N102]|uniref:hypothetical protein n=1 Tax=Saccharopolyspora sp. 5N102 TaxID=3375155 RepID=UPI0037A33BEC
MFELKFEITEVADVGVGYSDGTGAVFGCRRSAGSTAAFPAAAEWVPAPGSGIHAVTMWGGGDVRDGVLDGAERVHG